MKYFVSYIPYSVFCIPTTFLPSIHRYHQSTPILRKFYLHGFRTARTTDILPSNKEFWRMKAEIRRIKAAKEETTTALDIMVLLYLLFFLCFYWWLCYFIYYLYYNDRSWFYYKLNCKKSVCYQHHYYQNSK